MINLAAELSLVTKLKSLGANVDQVFDGLTTPQQRAPKVWAALEPMRDVLFAVRNGKHITLEMQFADAYGTVPPA